MSFFLGSVDKGVVEVTNCFCVPHKEHDDQVEAELSYALDVYEFNRRVNASENIVGMFVARRRGGRRYSFCFHFL